MKLSKTTWIFFGLAGFFYAFAWSEIASALCVLGFGFELLMWLSMFSDHIESKEKIAEKSAKDGNDELKQNP